MHHLAPCARDILVTEIANNNLAVCAVTTLLNHINGIAAEESMKLQEWLRITPHPLKSEVSLILEAMRYLRRAGQDPQALDICV